MKKRIMSLLLAACLLLTQLPAAAVQVFAQIPGSGTIDIPRFVNPLYEDVLDLEDFPEQEIQRPDPGQADAPLSGDTYISYSDARLAMREALKNRQETVALKYTTGSTDIEASIIDLVYDAADHTGVADEGDYLLWQIGTMGVSGEYYTNGYVNVIYTFTYYTTAEQEAEMDQAVVDLLEELDLYEASDYSKIKGIYDYICANITYDYENLYDDSYLLKFTPYAALVNKTAVCQGYAVLLYRLALELDVDSRVIVGVQTSSGGAHAWNIAELNEKYFNLDSTWDAGYTDYDFFLTCNGNFYDHTRAEDYDDIYFNLGYPMSQTDYDPYPSGMAGADIVWSYNAETLELTFTGTGAMDDMSNSPWEDRKNEIRTATVGEGITELGKSTFASCEKLKNVTLPSTLTAIRESVFEYCGSLNTLELPVGLETIGSSAFFRCYNLLEMTLPDGLQTIHSSAFMECSSLRSITIPDTVTDIGAGAFWGSGLEEIVFPEGITKLPNSVCRGCTELVSVTLPSGLTELEDTCFYDCYALSSITLPETLEIIGDSVFSNCNSIESLLIPAKVKSIGFRAFAGMSALQDVYFTGNAPVFDSSSFSSTACNVYYPQGNATWTEEVMQKYGGTLTWIPYDCVVSSGTYGENLTWSLDSNGVLTISGTGDMVWDMDNGYPWAAYKDMVTQVIVESGVTSVSEFAFSGYPNLANVTLGEGLTVIGGNAFADCTSLTQVSLPSSLKTLGACCFSRSPITQINLPYGLETIGAEAFLSTALTEIVIPNSVTSMGVNAFSDCTSLKSAVLSSGCTAIPMYAFADCTALETVIIPQGVTHIDWDAFTGCTSLNNVVLPETLVSLGADCFAGCTSLTSITIPASVTAFVKPFGGCTGLKEITFLGDAPEIVDSTAFKGVTAVIYYPADNDTWTEEVMQQYGGTLTWIPCGWVQVGDARYYYRGDQLVTGWEQIGNTWYFFASDGTMQTGWLKSGGVWYYLLDDGRMAVGLTEIDGETYYFASSGIMQTGWQKVDGKWYYLKLAGEAAKGWQKVDGKWYYMDASGVMQTGWLNVGGANYYFLSNGEMAIGLTNANGTYYYFALSGVMQKGWQKVEGVWYFFNGATGEAVNGWYKAGGVWYYLHDDGRMALGWEVIDGDWYYFDANGYMTKGWQKVDGTWYYMNSGGIMQTGWEKIDGNWYYFAPSGEMHTGWLYQGSYTYYLLPGGEMAVGTHVIDGVTYTFDSEGIMVG